MYENKVFEVPLGADLTLNFSPSSGTVNIAGWTLQFTVTERTPTDFPALLTIVPTVTNASLGDFAVAVTAAQCKSLGSGSFYYAAWRTDIGGQDALAIGKLIVKGTARRLL